MLVITELATYWPFVPNSVASNTVKTAVGIAAITINVFWAVPVTLNAMVIIATIGIEKINLVIFTSTKSFIFISFNPLDN